MNRRPRWIPALAATGTLTFFLGIPLPLRAQFVPPPPPAPAVDTRQDDGFGFGDEEVPSADVERQRWLADAGLDFSESTPRMQLNALQLYANFRGRLYPFYVFSSVPVIAPERDDLAKYYAHALLDEFGGLLNVSVAPQWCMLSAEAPDAARDADRPADPCSRNHHVQLQAQAGAKVIEVVGAETNDFAPALQLGFTARFRLDLQGEPTLSPEARQGLLVLRAAGFADAVLGPTYGDMFGTPDDEPFPVPFVGTVEASFFVRDHVYLTAGYSLASESRLGDRWYVSLSRNRSFTDPGSPGR